ncbi:hypothetical protein ACKWTF_015609 [Chironomus riparius]
MNCRKAAQNYEKILNLNFCAIFHLIFVIFNLTTESFAAGACDRTRKVFESVSYGEITDGINTNYTQDSHCEWLIKADNSSQFITLKFLSLKTECSYDYIFIYDGNSYSSPLLGSYSGQTEPLDITAYSGYMLILLYSDTNYNLDGFRAVFSITNCLNNCSSNGLCINHSCLCTDDNTGSDCSIKACDCGDKENRGFCDKNNCKCLNGYTGQTCSLHPINSEASQWHWLSNLTQSFTPRTAHTAIYHEKTDAVYLFGGYDLNRVLDEMEIFRFKDNKWVDVNGSDIKPKIDEKSIIKNVLLHDKVDVGISDGSWFRAALLAHVNAPSKDDEVASVDQDDKIMPSPRYGHAACLVGDIILIFGGKLANGSLSNDLWMYNISSSTWQLRGINSTISPPRLTRHTLTYVDTSQYVYLFGGSQENGEFSSQMFRIKIDSTFDQWEIVYPRGGKSFDYRIVAHTTTFHKPSNSLIIYGGIIAGVARFSKLSDRMFSFNLNENHWTEVFYPKTALRETSIPRERAFHTATIAGDYLIIFGGYSHRHNKEEICYDNQMYLYHLNCHLWINQEALGSDRQNYPKRQGVFAHAAALRNDSQLLVIGGYHGNVNNDFLAFTLPDMMVPSRNTSEGSICSNYKSSTECISNPLCGYCSSDANCYARTVSTCNTNLQTTRCHGVCPSLRDCQSCLIHGDSDINSCKWCVQNAKCHHINDREPCGESDFVEKISYQWWGKYGVEIGDKSQCSALDRPPGLTYMKYLYPYDWNMPDSVTIVNSTLVEFSTATAPSIDSSNSGEVLARLHGYLRLPDEQKEIVKVCGSYADITLKVSLDDESFTVANFSADQSICIASKWNKWNQQKVLIDLQARRQQKSQIHIHSKVALQNNATKAFTFEFLEPFSSGNCETYTNCFQCLSDNACGWCDLKSQCFSRTVNESSSCTDGTNWRYLILKSEQCINCSNYISCQSCSMSDYCEWWNDDKCERRGRSVSAIKDPFECPSQCHERTNCTSCLNDKGKCVWCQATSQCFSFSIYTSEFQFGLCREWIDQLIVTSTIDINGNYGHHQCKACSMYSNCSTCLRSLNCGWCYMEENPIEGACVDGDFSGSAMTCDVALNTTEPTMYKYESCPDVDECGLGIHDCNVNAECLNTHGSFNCQCKKGFIGDGKRKCDKTCDEKCIHGRCSNYPEYKCLCDLGWTGSDCSINCKCNNHSTCMKGVGICDECQDHTEGEYCDKCKLGSYGNATYSGCLACECHGHGNEVLGKCDQKTGKCFCMENTEGDNCEICSKGFYGDPKNNGRCYLQCQSRAMLKPVKSQGIGSFKNHPGVSECLWLIKLEPKIINESLIMFDVEDDMNITCSNNGIYVYNSISEFSDNFGQKQLLSVICKEGNAVNIARESKTGEMAIYFQKTSTYEGFNGILSVYSCALGTCTHPYTCDNSTNKCRCPDGFKGSKCDIEVCKSNCSFGLNQGFCDTISNQCVCTDGYAGDDCSQHVKQTSIVIHELFNTLTVSQNLSHLKKTLPRFGHSVNADRRGFLWIFGGYSLSNGALNDIRQFDTRNRTWMQVTVDGTLAKMPLGRYFHAAEISKQSIYIYGGLNNEFEVLDDFWVFNVHEHRWTEVDVDSGNQSLCKNVICGSPGALAGHTLTAVKAEENEALILIGGYKNSTAVNETLQKSLETTTEIPAIEPQNLNFSIVWEFNFEKKIWTNLNISGNGPKLIFGHSVSYHSQSQVLYIFGGYQLINGKILMSKNLFTLRKLNGKWFWNVLPVFNELNRPEENLPRGRFLHSSIAFQNYMIIHAGDTNPSNASDFMNAYIYKCNSYIRLTEGIEIIGNSPSWIYSQAVAVETDSDINSFYVIGGISSQFSIHKVSIPSDICQLWSGSKYFCRLNRGCSFATTTSASSSSNITRSTLCFSSDQKETKQNELTSSAFNWGAVCDELLLSTRNCTSFVTCDDCAALFPYEGSSACQWSTNRKCYVDKRPKNETEGTTPQFCASTSEKMIQNTSNCGQFFNCSSCLDQNCVWTSKSHRCMEKSFTPLLCSGLTCGAILQIPSECPKPCDSYKMCSKCLTNSNCGWEAGTGNGNGQCLEGNINYAYEKYEQKSWNYLTCPPEDECTNEHHNCDNVTEKCVDLLDGFKCVCADGYKPSYDKEDICVPICNQGCFFGTCVHPNVCKCDFGYVGANCSIACQCSGFSDCAGPEQLDVCLKCMNHTRGSRCEKCEKFYVKKDGKCESCSTFCHGHTDICVSSDLKDSNATVTELEEIISEGPSAEDAVCLNCGNFTNERRCETCLNGYFRGTTNLNEKCRSCLCNGHGNECDPVTGEKCNCGNNTESEQTCPASTSKTDKNTIQIFHCYMTQCTKCKDSYNGHPKNGHQCYKQITIESRMCINEAKPIEDCEEALESGKMQFFQIQPRFLNVDIRIQIDVTDGEIDLQMSSNDDSFIVMTNQSNGFHDVFLDSKYQWVQTTYEDDENTSFIPIVMSAKKSEGSSSPIIYKVIDRFANDAALSTYITLKQHNALLRVFGIKNRLVITLPQHIHNLSGTRFFIAIRAVNNAVFTTGIIYFRQDQLHIDLFVFFSVFFSCFFLFLAVCVVIWKAKQAADMRRARQRYAVEMLNMAQRPYSSVLLDVTPELQPESQSSPKTIKKSDNYVPVAIETTSDNVAAICTIFIRLPETKLKRRPVCMGSALISAPKQNAFLNKPTQRVAQHIM